MNNKIKTIFLSLALVLSVGLVFAVSSVALAESGKPNTAILDSSWGIEDILRVIISIMTVGVGVAATGSFVVAGFLYTTAGDDSNGNVKKAKTMISNTVIGIIAYVFMWAIINWIIPGGLF